MSCNNEKRQETTQGEGESKGFSATVDEINLYFIRYLIFVMTERAWCER